MKFLGSHRDFERYCDFSCPHQDLNHVYEELIWGACRVAVRNTWKQGDLLQNPCAGPRESAGSSYICFVGAEVWRKHIIW